MCTGKYYLFILLFINTPFVRAQTYTSINYSVNQGLPSAEVYQAYQDQEGFMWFGTDNGVVRFDGHEMQIFNTRHGLSDPVVFGFQEDKPGKIWFKSYSGRLSYYEDGKIFSYPHNDKIQSVIKNSLINISYSEATKQLDFVVRTGRFRIDSLGNMSMDSITQHGLFYYDVGEEGIWTLNRPVRNKHIISINNQQFTVELDDKDYSFKNHNTAARVKKCNGILYLTIRNHLFKYVDNAVELVHVGRAPIISLSCDNQNNIWVGYLNSGFDRFNPISLANTFKIPQLENLSITSVTHDRDNGLWITTLENGVYYFPNTEIENESFGSNTKISEVFSTPTSVVIGTQQGSLMLYSATQKNRITEKKFTSPIYSFFVDFSGKTWLCTESQLYILDSGFKPVRTHRADALNFIPDSDGLYINGGFRIEKFTWDGDLLSKQPLPYIYRSILLKDSLFYLAGRTGVEVRSKDLALLKNPQEFKNMKITSLIDINDSTLLACTMGNGLVLMNKSAQILRTYNSDNLFIANDIYTAIIKDSTVWLGTEKGLFAMNITSLLSGRPSFTQWNKQNGLLANDIRFLSVNSENVWAFSESGYSIIPKKTLLADRKNPIPYIKNLTINEDSVNPKISHRMPHNKTKVIVTIGFLSFNSQAIYIRFRLSPKDPWAYTTERTLQFSSLAPNHYKLIVEYSIDNVNWLDAQSPVNFTVIKPWWSRWYTLVLFAGILVLAVFYYFKRRLYIQKQKNELLQLINQQQQELVHAEVSISEKERKRLAKELHDSIGTQLTAIKLNIVNILNNRNQPDDLKKIDTHLQNTIDEVRSMAYSLTPPEIERYGLFTALSNHFDKIMQTSGIRVDFSTYGDDIQTNELSISIFRILQELSSNTMKHTKAKNIKVTINSFEQTVNILYEDDGGGFDPEKAKNGLGLSNIISRVGAIGGTSNFESTAFGVSYVFEFPKNGL